MTIYRDYSKTRFKMILMVRQFAYRHFTRCSQKHSKIVYTLFALWLTGELPTFGQCPPTFAEPVNFGVGAAPTTIALGDFNADGKPDLAVANSGSTYVSILFGVGNGTFAGPVNYPAGGSPGVVAISDLNNDGRVDLLVLNVDSGISFLFGTGNGVFSTPLNTPTSYMPVAFAIADLNSDGRPDLVVVKPGHFSPPNSGATTVYLGNGDGTFTQRAEYAGGSPWAVSIGDLNGDGRPDVTISNGYEKSNGDQAISVLAGNGDGTLAAAVDYTVGNAYDGDGSPYTVAIGDLNGDGRPDLAVPNNKKAYVLLGIGDGTFVPAVGYTAGVGPFYTAIGDINGDGRSDLIVTNSSSNDVSVLLGNGDGTLGAASNYTVAAFPYSPVIGDFNSDGRPDIAVATSINNNNISVLFGTGPMIGITQQPTSQAVVLGQTASFSVIAPGASSYQWRHRGMPLSNGGHYSGVLTNTLTIANVTTADAGPYDVRIIGGCNSGQLSKPAMLCVMAPVCRGDFNNDGMFNTSDIPAIVSALLAGQTCP